MSSNDKRKSSLKILNALRGRDPDVTKGFSTSAASVFPLMNVYAENSSHLIVELGISGFELEDIEIHAHDDMLIIIGDSRWREQTGETDRAYIFREVNDYFVRSIHMPKKADTENIDAILDNGILKLAIPLKDTGHWSLAR